MNKERALETLAAAVDPLLLVNFSGAFEWWNASASSALPADTRSQGLSAFLEKSAILTISKTKHYGSFEVIPTAGILKDIKQTAVILEISKDELEDPMFLLMLTSTRAEGASLKEKQEWLTSAAHDLKNPLSAIFGYSDTLLDTPAGEGLTPDQRTIIARIRGTASRATELVRNYQHLSQLALRGVAQSGLKCDLNAALHDVIHTTWREDPQHPRVILNLAKEQLPALVDRLHLDRILSNLFSNALKFSPPDSTVTLTTGKDGAGFVWAAVHNWGPPLPESERDSLFTPFNRLTNSKGKPGSGLGLTIVKRIVDGLGGEIVVDSSKDNGTTFTVRIPS